MATAKKIEVLVLELTDKRPSIFVLEGTEKSENPVRLDSPSTHDLRTTSVVMEKGVRKKIRYIDNCETIYVADQEKQGFVPNPKQDIISFEFGKLTVAREGRNIGLYDFLLNHEGNETNPNRPTNATTRFRQINTAAQAEKEIGDIDSHADALNILRELRKKAAKGVGWVYDTEKIEKLVKLFNLVNVETSEERMRTLIGVANQNPELFLRVVEEGKDVVKMEILKARELSVIVVTDENASLPGDNGRVFHTFKEKKNAEIRMNELAEYLGSDAGADDLNYIKSSVEIAERNAVS